MSVGSPLGLQTSFGADPPHPHHRTQSLWHGAGVERSVNGRNGALTTMECKARSPEEGPDRLSEAKCDAKKDHKCHGEPQTKDAALCDHVAPAADGQQESLLGRAVAYYNGRAFNTQIDEFIRTHAHAFQDAVAQDGTLGQVEHRLEYTELHRRFLALFEELLTDFLEVEGVSSSDFYRECEEAIEDRFCALFEEHKYHWFVDALCASSDYDYFYALMVQKARSGAAEGKPCRHKGAAAGAKGDEKE